MANARYYHQRYTELAPIWGRNSACLEGQAAAKAHDKTLTHDQSTLLVPFSTRMQQDQWDFYLHEAELPGIAEQFARTVRGGMLRKPVVIDPPEGADDTLEPWLRTRPGVAGEDLLAFLHAALWEELKTSRAWIYVNHPGDRDEPDGGPPAPYMELVKALELTDWHSGVHPLTGQTALLSATVCKTVRIGTDNDGRPVHRDRMYVHELDSQGYYRVRVFQRSTTGALPGVDIPGLVGFGDFEIVSTQTDITNAEGERLREIPLFPLNGLYDPLQPVFETFCNREIALYNKQSRKNHLLYGTATYTPVLKTDGDDSQAIRSLRTSGLGSLITIGQDDDLDVLQIDPAALDAWGTEIEAVIGQLAKMGVRMLAKEMDESGVAIELRNAGQTSQLAALSRAISQMLQRIFTFMARWRYGSDLEPVKASLSPDLTSSGLGADEMRLLTEWYMAGVLDRPTWIAMAKANDFLPADYNDEGADQRIADDGVLTAMFDRMMEMNAPAETPGGSSDQGGGGTASASQR